MAALGSGTNNTHQTHTLPKHPITAIITTDTPKQCSCHSSTRVSVICDSLRMACKPEGGDDNFGSAAAGVTFTPPPTDAVVLERAPAVTLLTVDANSGAARDRARCSFRSATKYASAMRSRRLLLGRSSNCEWNHINVSITTAYISKDKVDSGGGEHSHRARSPTCLALGRSRPRSVASSTGDTCAAP